MSGSIVVLISGRGSNLQSLLKYSHSESFIGKVDLVLCNRSDAAGLKIAQKAGVRTRLIDHQNYASREAFEVDLIKQIDSVGPDLVVLAGFMRILTKIFVEHYAERIMNIHPSLLPKYPGLNTHQKALQNGDRYAGATVHYVTAELDHGPPIIQAKIPILTGDDPKSLGARVLNVEHEIYPEAISWHLKGRLELKNNYVFRDGLPLPHTGFQWKTTV